MKKHIVNLPAHEDMKGTRICPMCAGMMVPHTETITVFTASLESRSCASLECEPPYGGKEACELYKNGACAAKTPVEVTVTGVKGYKCASCGEVVYNSSEAKLIEEAVKPYMQSKEL